MTLKKYKVFFKEEKFYEVDLETEHDPNTDDGEDKIIETIQEDYLNRRKDLTFKLNDRGFKLGEIVEID